MTMQGGTARDRLRARAQAMYGGKRREDEEQQNRQNQRQEVESPAVGSARDRLRQRASAMGEVTGQGKGESITMPERKTTWTDKVRSGGRTGNYTTAASTPEQKESVLRKGLSGKHPQRTDAEQVESLLRKGGTTEAVKASKKTGGKFDVGDYSKLLGESFAQGVAEGTAGTLAAGETLIGKGLDKLFPGAGFEGSGFFNALYNGRPDWKFFGENGLVGIRQSREYTQQKLAEDVEDIETGSELGTKVAKKAASFGGDVAYGMGNALPMAAEAVITGGTSLLPTTTKELETLGINVVQKSGLAGKLEEAAKLAGNTLRSREYWTSFFSEVGMDYYEALDNGATDDEATRYALSSALVNSVIEIGGGIQKIPEAPTFRTWIKGAHEEGMEEIQQGIVSRLMENVVYDKKNPLVSVTDENAVVNPVTAANEYAGGFAVGGLLGGVQQGMAKRAQTRQEAELAQYQERLDKLGEEFTPAAKEMAQERLSLDSEDYTAQKVMNALDSGEAVSGEDIRTLIRDNVNAHNTAALAEIKEKIAQRLTDLGETKDANAVADAMVRYFTGETRGKDKASRKQRAADQDTIFRSRYGDHVGQELLQTKNVPQWVQGLPSLTTVYEYEQAHRPVAEQQTGAEAPATQEAETAVEQRAEATEQSAEPVKLTSAIVRKAAASRETLEQLGIDPKGKTGSQLRAEVRQALMERQAVAQEVQQRTQVAQQTQETARQAQGTPVTQDTARQAQETPVTLEEASKAYGKQAKAFLRTYQQGQDVEKFSEAYRIAHEMGESNVPYRVVQGLRSLDYLTEAQKDIAYRTGASAEQQERGGRKATWRRQGVVRAENGAKLSDLSKTFNVPQKQGYRILSDIAKSTGVDIVLYRSKGDAEGNITEAEGRFRRSENTIYIDVNSGIANVSSTADFSQYTMLRTFNHEFTHFIENADEEYRELRKLVFETMQEKLDGQGGGVTVDDLIREKQDKYRQALGQEISYDEASREVVADAMTDILPDSHFMETLYNRNATLAEKLIGKLKDFIAKVKAYFDGLTTNTKAEAALLKEMRDGGLHYLERIVEAYDKAAMAAVENYQGADKVLQENGIDVSEDGKSASMDAFSVRTMLNEKQQKSVEKALAERFDVTEEEAGGWLKAETSLASIILNPKYSMYLDYEADAAEEAIKKNLDYPQGTVDFSTICKKRRDFTDVMNRIFRVYPNHVFQAEDLAKIRTIMQQEGMNVACGICYVEDRRQLDSIVAEDFLQALELYRNGSETRPDGKPFNQNQLRGLRYTNGDTYVPTVAELITLEGNNALKKKNPNMAEAWRRYNNARGMQSVRRLTNEAEYKRQILKYSKRTVQSKNSKGGLRIFSFSDMEMFHLLDVMQIITDASTKGLYIQGYTKVNEYAKAVKDTGLKLNRSLIPAGDLGYHMEGGKPVLDFDTTEGIDIHAKDFFDSSGNPNIGNIVIGINDTQIRAAMVSEFIDQIIPFHTGQSKAVLREKRIDAWENYKDYQTDKDMETGKTAKQQVNIYTDVLQVLEREGAEITKRSFVEKYLEVCRERGLIPRFAQFLNQDAEGNYVYTEGYHKLLVDFKTFAQTEKGEYLPQKDVRPVFDEQYLTGILKDYAKEQSRRDSAMKKQMPQVIQRISDEVVQEGDVQFSLREPVEETRDLLALHNMTADNLRGALKLGGLPMPSIAIVKAAAGHSKYGPISVVFEKSTIDPQADRRNKVYGGDAYTPTAPKVEYPVNDRAMRKVEKHLAELSGQVAGGIFLNDTALRRLGIEDESSMNADALAERLARDDSVQAAYLADSGKALEPVRQPKEFSKFGNGALQQLVSEVGVQELARINAEMQTGNYAAVREIEGTIRDIIRSTYEVQHRGFLDRKPELKQKRIAHYMENNVNIRTVEDFARDAWNFYQDNGATTDEIDRWATADKLHEMVTQDQVEAWLRPQLEGLLGEAGIYNGKERYTSSGNQRSFAQTHYAYTLENIVRAMAETQKERGGQTFGVTAKTMQAVSTPSYDSIAAIKADSGRLGAVEGKAYDAAVQKVETQIEQAIRKVMRENKPHSDNQFDEMEIIGEVMMEAAKGTKTEAAIQRAFQKEDYTISKETAKMVQKLFRDAAALPTEYFEAKPQRAVPFNEAAAVVVPDDLPVGLKKGLEELGATVREYKAGDEQSRLEAVNAIPDVQFSIREIKGEDGTNYGKGVYLDSTLLEGLTDAERKEMMRERVKELGGQTITAYDPNGEAVDIRIAAPSEKFRNRNGRRVPVTNDLARKNRDVKVKQESVVLADELIATSQYKRPRKAKYPHGWLDNNGKNDWQYWTTYIQDKNNTVWEATLNVAESANGVKYLYDIDPIEKVGQPVKSGTSTTLVGQPVKSGTSTTGDIVAQDQTESQAQIRSSTLSDRDVLRIAAQMAKNSESRSLTDADRARLGIIEQKLGRIDEAEEQRQGFLEEKRAILAGREAKELSDAERAQLRKVQKNLDTVNGKIRRLNEELSQTQEKKVVRALLKKARVVVERDAVQQGVARLNEYKNRRSAAELRTSIKKTAKGFQQMLLHPTDTKYAPESLIQSCIDVATMLDTSGEREDTKAKAQYRSMMDALNTLKTQYDELKNSPDSDFRGEYDTNFAYMVEQLAKRLGGKPVRDLTLTELQDVHSVLRDIQTMLRNAKYQIGQAERITNYAVGESIIRDMEKIPERTVAEQAMDTTSRLTISTLRNIRRLTMYNDNSQLVRLFDALNDGIKKKNRFMMECDKLFERFLGKRFRKAAGLIKSYNVGTRTFKMTEMEAIQLVLTWEREAHGETSHLAKGGFIIPNHYLLKKGKFKDAFLKGTTYSRVQQSEIDAIQRTFDKWALDYKAAVKNEFFNGIAKNAINNTTLQLKGRAVALTPDYVTVEVDKNSVVTELEGVKFDATIEGMGMLKSVVKGASNPVIIRGVHSLVESHIERVGQLYGLAIPIRNFNKAYNVKTVDGTSSVRGAIGKTWSAADLEMIEQAISDLQTPRKRADVFDKMVRKATSSFVKAKLLSNISVTIKQAASYSTAGLYLSQKALFPYQTTVVGLFVSNKSKFAKKLFAEIDEHTAEHYIRRKGMSMQEINTIAKDNSKIVRAMDDNLPDAANPLKWIQNMDVATTAALWLATKKQVALDGMKTTDPGYWDAVTSLYEKVIEETQPMYDILHRPEVQKTPNEIVRGVLMFRTQPLQNTGILYDAFGELNQAVKSKDAEWVKRARKKAAMAVGSQLASLAVFSVMTLLAAAARNRLTRYLDDEDELTIQSIMIRVLGDMATNGAGLLIPIGGNELAELVESQVTGSNYGGEFSVSVVDMLNDYIDQFGKCWKDVADLDNGGREKLPTDLRDLSMDTAGLFGIPAENVFNIIRGVVGNISDTFSEEPVQWATDNPDPNVAAIKAAFDNGHMDTAKDKIVELIAFKVKSGKTEKEAASSVRSSITSYYKPLYLKALRNGDKEEMRRIASIIKASGLYSEGTDATLEKWASAAD